MTSPIDRRSFLIAGSLTALASSRAFGANNAIRVGVIGAGSRMNGLLGAADKAGPYQIVAVSDVYAPHRDAVKERSNGLATTHLDYREVLEKEIDAVFIASPDHWHVRMAADALAAGKDVYLEKPVTHTLEEGATLTRAVRSGKQILQCGTQQRSGAHYKRAKQEIFDAGKLGNVVFARAVWHNFPWQSRTIPSLPKPAGLNWDLFLGPAPHVPYETARYSSWRSYHDYGNGLLADILTHWADVAQWMLSDSKPVSAVALGGDFQLHGDLTNPDTVSAIVRYKNWNLNFESSVLSIRNDRPSVFFEGTEGTLDITREGYTFTPNSGAPIQVTATQNLERAHTGNFIDAIVKGDKVNAPLADGLAASLPVMMALESYWSNKICKASELT